jgi:capsular exopolysaccharide synthesis family protein
MKESSQYFIRRGSVPLPEESDVTPYGASDYENPHVWEYARTIRKHLWLILAAVGAVVLAAGLRMLTMTPIFTAQSTILVERNVPKVLAINDLLSENDEADVYYRTQYGILKSRSLAASVIKEEGLGSEEPAASAAAQPGLIAGMWSRAAAQVYGSPEGAAKVRRSSEHAEGGVKPELIDAYLNALDVAPIQGTRLVKVGYSSPNPELSARIANAHCMAYIRQGLGLYADASGEAQRYLDQKLVELRERVEKSEIALNNYRREKGILALSGRGNIVVDRLSDLNKELTEAEGNRIALEAQVKLIRERSYDYIPEVVNSTLIQTLKQNLIQLQGQYASLALQFKSSYPPMAQLEAQVDETRRRLAGEVDRVVGGIQSAYLAASAREKELHAKLDEQRGLALGLKDDSVQYAILQREVDTNRQLYDSVLQRLKEMGISTAVRLSNVSIIDKAEPPLTPSSPRRAQGLMMAAIVGLAGGLGLAFVLEYLDDTLKNPQDAERYLNLPSLGIVPRFGEGARAVLDDIRGPQAYLATRIRAEYSAQPVAGSSMMGEAYRALRTTLVLARAAGPPQSVLFTSAAASEGKTMTALNAAIAFANLDAKVLVIDADLRRPRCHEILNMPNGTGLTEALSGQSTIEEVIQSTSVNNLSFISAGASSLNSTDLLGSGRMQALLGHLRKRYDYILIDCSPVMLVSDALAGCGKTSVSHSIIM